jgi:sucrose-6-phosphate hydrolase SacC (GH32 family)
VLNRDSADFRDPKVFRYERGSDSCWIMVAVEAVQRKVVIYSSANLIDWTYLSDFGPANAVDGVWECPDLFPLPLDGDPGTLKWVLTVNLNPGGPNGGSAGQYFVGEFDGVVFRADATAALGPDGRAELSDCDWLDWGRDYYAAVSFNDAPEGKRIMIGWMNNWDYANNTPTAPWRGHMSLPRQLSLITKGGRPVLVHAVANDDELRASGVVSEHAALRIDGEVRLDDVDCSEIQIIDVEFEAGMASEFGVLISGTESTGTRIGVRATDGVLFLDRTRSGSTAFHESFPSIETAPILPQQGRYRLSVYVDHTSIEVFAQGGEVALSDAIFPLPGARSLTIYASGGPVTMETLRITALNGRPALRNDREELAS